jgi:hypothetical protein
MASEETISNLKIKLAELTSGRIALKIWLFVKDMIKKVNVETQSMARIIPNYSGQK